MSDQARTIKGPMALGTAFLLVIMGWLGQLEGNVHKAYLDNNASPPVWTICMGVTGPDVVEGLELSDKECVARMQPMIQAFSDRVLTCVVVPVFVREHLAYLLLAWNIGTNAFCQSSVVKRANRQDYAGACDAILMWKRAGGKDCSARNSGCYGIWVRRQIERNICRGYLVVPGVL